MPQLTHQKIKGSRYHNKRLCLWDGMSEWVLDSLMDFFNGAGLIGVQVPQQEALWGRRSRWVLGNPMDAEDTRF